MDTISIRELRARDEVIQAYPVIKQLRSHLDEATYLELIMEAQEKESYRMLALFDGEELVAVIGFQPMITLYYGRFIWICDLVTTATNRSQGNGERLLAHVEEWARNNHYEAIALSSGQQRTDAHRFYEGKMSYDKVSYVFKKSLEG